MPTLADLASVAQAPTLIIGAPATGQQSSLRVLRGLGDNVDDAIHGIGAPHRSPGPSNDLDPLDVLE